MSGSFPDPDPVPEHVLAAGRAAMSLRIPGAILATIVSDDQVTAGVRGSAARLITFHGADVRIEIEVDGTGHARQIAGQIIPSDVHVTAVVARSPYGEMTAPSRRDGSFVLSRVPRGPMSLMFRLRDNTTLVTSWVRI